MCMNAQVRARLMLRRNCFGVVGWERARSPPRERSEFARIIRAQIRPSLTRSLTQSPVVQMVPHDGDFASLNVESPLLSATINSARHLAAIARIKEATPCDREQP
jgi:hypothetical protein